MTYAPALNCIKYSVGIENEEGFGELIICVLKMMT